ncbi:hypothetical protein Bbelb_116920 [Branchiostoma belcheri]|nr:hypothetical protein Bbelb_116920 [Branchiostoma belcheri]
MPGHNQKDFEERGGKMGYMTKHPSEKDPETGRPLKVFTPVSNFTFDIKEKITGDDAGFLVEITCHADDKKGLRYIPIGASRADFCIHANKTLGDADWGGLNTSMSDVAFRTLLVNKQLDFETTPPVKSRRGTTIVGKVEDEDIWVFNDEVHLEAVEDEHGQWHVKTVKKGEQKYKLLPSTLNQTANVTLPLTLDPMLVAVPVMKEAFQHNFHSAIFVLGHSCMGMHAEIVASRFDSCPVTIAVGQSGLGKTMAVRTALAMLGIGDTGLIRQFKREAMVSMASRTTLGCFLDDPQSLNARKEAAIDFHGMGVFYTLSRGVESAKCGFLMTANHPLFQPEERDLRRMNYLPFFGPKISDTGGAKSRVDLKMMRDEGRLSSCMRTLVSIGISFRTEGWKEVLEMQKKWVLELPGVMKDILLNYSILLWFTNKVSINLGVSLDDIETFRKEHIVPYIKQYMCEAAVHDDMKLSVLSAVREDVASWITGADPEELDDTVRIGFVSYSKQPSMPAVESLLVTSESLASAVVVPAATVREYLKATNQGMSTTLPYRVQGKNKRFTVFKWDCFTPDQQTGIRNAIKKEQAEKLTTDNGTATETEPEDRPAARDTATETEPENEPAASDTDNGKLRFYKTLKSDYSMEKYLYHNEFDERAAMSTETEPEDRPAARDTAAQTLFFIILNTDTTGTTTTKSGFPYLSPLGILYYTDYSDFTTAAQTLSFFIILTTDTTGTTTTKSGFPFLSPLGILHYTDFTTAAQTLFFMLLTVLTTDTTDTTGTTTTKSGFPYLSPLGVLNYTDYSDFTTAAQTLFFIILTTDTTGTTTTKSDFPFLSPLGILYYTDYSDFTTAAQTLFFIILTTDTTGTTTTKSDFPFLSPLGILHYTDFTTAAQTLFFMFLTVLTTDTTGTTTTKAGFPFLSPLGVLHYTDYSDFTTAAQTLFFIILTTDTTGTTTTKSDFPFLSPLGILHYTDFTTAAQTLFFMFLTVLTTDTTGTTTTKAGFPYLSPLGVLHYTDYTDFTTAAQTLFFIILTTDTTGTTTTKAGFPYLSPLGVLHYTDYTDFTTAAQTLFFIILTTDTTGTTTTKSGFPYMSPLGILHYTDYNDFTTAAQTLFFMLLTVLTTDTTGTTTTKSGFPYLSPRGILDYTDFTTAAQTLFFMFLTVLTTDTSGTTTTKAGFPYLSPLGILHYTDYTDFTTAAQTHFFMFLTVLTTDTTGTTTTKAGFPYLSPLGILHYTDYTDFTTAAQTLFFIILTTDTTALGILYYTDYSDFTTAAQTLFFMLINSPDYRYYRYYHYKSELPISVTSRGILHYTDYSDFTTAAQTLFFVSMRSIRRSGAFAGDFVTAVMITNAYRTPAQHYWVCKSGVSRMFVMRCRSSCVANVYPVTNVYRNPAQHHSDCKSGVSRKIRDALPVVMRRTVSAARSDAVVSGCVNAGAVYPSAFAGMPPGRHGEYDREVGARNPACLDARRANFVMSYMEHVPKSGAAQTFCNLRSIAHRDRDTCVICIT